MGEQVLIATLGAEPQVVTLVKDLLEARNYVISRVIVVYTAGRNVRPALQRLKEELGTALEAAPVRSTEGVIEDIATEAHVAALLRTLYQIVLAEKRAGRTVHLSIAGGRKPMAVQGMVVAQLLFDEEDRVWHLLSEGWQPGDERVMHVRPGDRVSLVPVPVLRWSTVSPVLTELARHEDPWEAIQIQRALQREEDHRQRREFVEHDLTRAEREVMRLACQGMDNATIAKCLHKSEKTVANQLTRIYDKFREWCGSRGMRDDVAVSRTGLAAEFAAYLAEH